MQKVTGIWRMWGKNTQKGLCYNESALSRPLPHSLMVPAIESIRPWLHLIHSGRRYTCGTPRSPGDRATRAMPNTASRPLNCFDSCFAEAARPSVLLTLLSLALLPSGTVRRLGQSRNLPLSTQRSPWLSLSAIALVCTNPSAWFAEPLVGVKRHTNTVSQKRYGLSTS